MKICATADLHGHLPKIPQCDLLIIAGDICPADNHHVYYQEHWLNTTFKPWLKKVPANKIIGIAGNHDFIFEKSFFMPHLPWTYLEDEAYGWNGLNFYGTPWQPPFFDWAFNANDERRKIIFERIPLNTHILITHGPPHGYGDQTRSGENVGCKFLRERLELLTQLKLHVFGHIHESRGVWQLDSATLANATLVNYAYDMVYEPMVFEIRV